MTWLDHVTNAGKFVSDGLDAFKTFSKEPGLGQVVKPTVMDMKYSTQFEVRKRCVRNESAIGKHA